MAHKPMIRCSISLLRREVDAVIEGQHEQALWLQWPVSCLWSLIHGTAQSIIYPYTCKWSQTGGIWRRHIECINVNVLVVTVHYSFSKCHHPGKLGKVHKRFLCMFLATACISTIISKKKRLKVGEFYAM